MYRLSIPTQKYIIFCDNSYQNEFVIDFRNAIMFVIGDCMLPAEKQLFKFGNIGMIQEKKVN